MSTTNRVFVSPGIYTSEKDLSFVTRQVGVTTLGLAGETSKGPAFQPIFVSDFNEFKNFFGGLNPTRFSDTGYPKYELPYIAKSYFTKSNQLYVTRVLGLSGYDAGLSWAITADNGQVISLLRSRASYDTNEILNFEVLNSTDLIIDPSVSAITADAKAEFTLSGVSQTTGAFTYNVSFDSTKKNFITRVLGTNAETGKAPVFVEEIYSNMLDNLIATSGVTGLNTTIVENGTLFEDYKTEYLPAVTPWVVSEVQGNVIKKLFRLITISDGNTANREIKISIENIKPDQKEFDIRVRAFNDIDANAVTLERFSRCTMDPTSDNFVARRIGTLDGFYVSKSNYVLLELDEDEETFDSFPAGFTGVPARVYASGSTAPSIGYNQAYVPFTKIRKIYLGLSDTVGIDQNFFNFLGADPTVTSGVTNGYHMDVDASGATLAGYTFVYGDSNIQTDAQLGLSGNSYTKLYSRKFTFAPYGGFDGWDIYRTNRTNQDTYTIGGVRSTAALASGAIASRVTSTADLGTNSDYYAYFEAINTFNNPEAININVLGTPGIDTLNNTNLVEATVEMVEEKRCDSIYIVTTPDTEFEEPDVILDVVDLVERLDDTGIDSNYTATYWPWVQVNDTDNNVSIYLPPTRDVCRNIALTDNVSFPWFAVAGVQRGVVQAIKARLKLTLDERDVLYEGRINPIATFASEGLIIFGNKNLQTKDTSLNRLNVRRLLLQARKLISAVSIRLLFEQNDEVVRSQFKALVNPILENIRSERGMTDFRVEVDNSPESIDRGELNGRIFIKPTRALEFITVEFVVMNTGASFDDV
jgi:hypothetical protein